MKKLYVGNLPFSVTEENIRTEFAGLGIQTDSITLVRDRETGQSRGFGFVEISDDHAAEKAIAGLNGKDLLTALIGVLGTIVGFYFGQSQEAGKGMTIAPVYVSSETPKEGETVQLVTFVSGGRAPYTYDVVFAPPKIIEDVKQSQSADGQIVVEIRAPKVDADTEVSFSIRVKDSDGKEASYDSRSSGKKLVLKK